MLVLVLRRVFVLTAGITRARRRRSVVTRSRQQEAEARTQELLNRNVSTSGNYMECAAPANYLACGVLPRGRPVHL